MRERAGVGKARALALRGRRGGLGKPFLGHGLGKREPLGHGGAEGGVAG